jgi:hypothetical protein
VQQKINSKGGSIAFVDDYTAWVVGPSADANHSGIQRIVDKATQWERRSGATFQTEKTTLVHFTRIASQSSVTPILIIGEHVTPKTEAKILGVIMDSELRYRKHIAKAATKGLKAALALRRLKMLSPSTARQLFGATVAPVMDYASNVWMHIGKGSIKPMERPQTIIGSFRTVALANAEAEACIRPIHQRHQERAIKLWIGMHTLQEKHLLRKLFSRGRIFRRYTSPLQKMAQEHQTHDIETIVAYPIAPWEKRINVELESQKAFETI